MIRPIKIFLYFLLVVMLVALLEQWLREADISLIPPIGHLSPVEQTEDTTFAIEISPKEEIKPDDTISPPLSLDTLISSDTTFRQTIFPEDSILIAPPEFQKQFRAFCQQAERAQKNGEIIRILHLGDSQIEADRITSVLRKHFQNLYSGSGPGFIMPFDPMRINANVQLKNEGEWNLEYSYRENNYPDEIDFGFPGKAVWFSGQKAGFTISPVSWESSKTRRFSNIGLLLTPFADSTKIQISADATFLSDSIISPSDNLQLFKVQTNTSPNELNFSFTSNQSPVFHGLTLDGDHGVAVDNMAMRGRPWPGMRLADQKMLKSMGQQLNIGLIIIQFGTNVLPTETDNYNFYRIHFLRELRKLQNILPNVPVLVIGVQAAATKTEGEIKPLQHAALISNAQKSAALSCKMGFFDLHKMMGGDNGAIEWAKHQPPLMLTDYMHFSNHGAREVGDKIWQTLDSLRIETAAQVELD